MASAKDFVEKKINGKSVVMFSKAFCPFCKKAKSVLNKYKIPADKYEVVEIEDRDDCSDIQDYLRDKTGGRSVPRVFIGGDFIGGGDETAAMDASGQLEPKLKAAGAI